MLQNLRDYFPKWVIISLLGLLTFLIAFLGLYIPTSRGFGFKGKTIARVYGKKIPQSQLEQEYNRLRQLVMHVNKDQVNNIPEVEQQLRMFAFQSVLDKASFAQHAYQQGYRAHPSDIRKILQQIPAFQIDNRFSSKKFTEALFMGGVSKASFLADLTESYITHQVQHAIAHSAFVLPKEMRKALRLTNQQRDFEYVEIEASHFIQPATLVSDEAAQDYYDHHLTELRVPERVSIEYVLLSPIEEKVNLNENSSNNIQAKTNEIETSIKQQADSVERLTQLTASHPMSLKEVAQEIGLEIQTTPLFDRSEKSLEITRYPEVVAAAFSESVLKGFNSPVLHLGADRFMVLRLKEHQPLHLPSFEAVKQTIQEKLAMERAKALAKETGEKIVEQIKQSPASAISLPHSMIWHKVMHASRYEKNISSEILNAAFKINQRSSTVPVTGFALPNGNYVVIRLRQVRYGKMTQPDDEQSKPYQEELVTQMGQFDNILYRYANRVRANIVIFS